MQASQTWIIVKESISELRRAGPKLFIPILIGALAIGVLTASFLDSQVDYIAQNGFEKEIVIGITNTENGAYRTGLGARLLDYVQYQNGVSDYGADIFINFFQNKSRVYVGDPIKFNIEVAERNKKGIESKNLYYLIFILDSQNNVVGQFPDYAEFSHPLYGATTIGEWQPCSYQQPESTKLYSDQTKSPQCALNTFLLSGKNGSEKLYYSFDTNTGGNYDIYVLLFNGQLTTTQYSNTPTANTIEISKNTFTVDTGRKPVEFPILGTLVGIATLILAALGEATWFSRKKEIRKHLACIYLVNILIVIILLIRFKVIQI